MVERGRRGNEDEGGYRAALRLAAARLRCSWTQVPRGRSTSTLQGGTEPHPGRRAPRSDGRILGRNPWGRRLGPLQMQRPEGDHRQPPDRVYRQSSRDPAVQSGRLRPQHLPRRLPDRDDGGPSSDRPRVRFRLPREPLYNSFHGPIRRGSSARASHRGFFNVPFYIQLGARTDSDYGFDSAPSGSSGSSRAEVHRELGGCPADDVHTPQRCTSNNSAPPRFPRTAPKSRSWSTQASAGPT